MSIVLTLFYFILALILLVIVHEYGHFLVARCCGVKVLRFSFGFGKVLARRYDKHGTEYAWSLFPIGGYVKMLDEEEGPVAKAERHLAFNRKPVWMKIAVVFAGPLFNFIFAFCALWLVLVVGIQSLAPMIDSIQPGSIAAKSGLLPRQEIIAFNHHPVSSWRDVQFELMTLVGTTEPVPITVKSMVNGEQQTRTLALDQWQYDGKNPDILATLGIKPFIPAVPPEVGEVVENSPAQIAGFQKGDVILSFDGVAIKDWLDILGLIKNNPGKLMPVEVKRHGQLERFTVKVGVEKRDGRDVGVLGLRSIVPHWPAGWLRVQRKGPVEALQGAFKQTLELTGASFSLIGRMVMGRVSLQGISGPIGIAQGAGESARSGFSYYMFFLALISISLGVLNLLPIPLLDGGHLLFYVVELIRRRPLSVEFKSIGMYIGFIFLMALMVLALSNDIGRLANQF